jgi:hypothetical protein
MKLEQHIKTPFNNGSAGNQYEFLNYYSLNCCHIFVGNTAELSV